MEDVPKDFIDRAIAEKVAARAAAEAAAAAAETPLPGAAAAAAAAVVLSPSKLPPGECFPFVSPRIPLQPEVGTHTLFPTPHPSHNHTVHFTHSPMSPLPPPPPHPPGVASELVQSLDLDPLETAMMGKVVAAVARYEARGARRVNEGLTRGMGGSESGYEGWA